MNCKCSYCGNVHTRLYDVVCPISFNSLGLPLSQDGKKEAAFALEIATEATKSPFVETDGTERRRMLVVVSSEYYKNKKQMAWEVK